MSNVFQKIGTGIKDVGVFVKDAVVDILGIGAKIKKILQAEKALEPAFIQGLTTVVTGTETLIALSGTAVTAEGLNFAADSAAYAQFVTLIADLKAFAPIVEAALLALDGKTPTATIAPTS